MYETLYALASDDTAYRKIFVRGLAWETTTERLLEVFGQYGPVEEGAVVRNNSTGKSKGYGFVTFKTMEAAQRALESPAKSIDVRHAAQTLKALPASTLPACARARARTRLCVCLCLGGWKPFVLR